MKGLHHTRYRAGTGRGGRANAGLNLRGVLNQEVSEGRGGGRGQGGMADLYTRYERSPYYDRQSGLSNQEYHETIEKSTCLYVGNLSYYTTENQIVDFFSRAGEVSLGVVGGGRRHCCATGMRDDLNRCTLLTPPPPAVR